MEEEKKQCSECGHKYKDNERRFITDEFGTFAEEICPGCHEYI